MVNKEQIMNKEHLASTQGHADRSDTPRTDGALTILQISYGLVPEIDRLIDFARRLERDRALLRGALRKCESHLDEYEKKVFQGGRSSYLLDTVRAALAQTEDK